MKKWIVLTLSLILFTIPVYAEEQVTYNSQPEQLTVFLNDIAYARDTLNLTGAAAVQIALPAQIFPDTLIVRENGARVPAYSLRYTSDAVLLMLKSTDSDAPREITLEYLVSGVGWNPNYDMIIPEDTTDTNPVPFAFFAEIHNALAGLDSVDMTLVAGRVDTSRQVDTRAAVTANQYIAGYDTQPANTLAAGAVTIQHTYPIGTVSAEPGDMLYVKVLEKALPARRVLLWNAQADQRVTVIYKVKNDSDIALAEGIVRSYQGGLFTGSDFIEFTPVGSEGSVTVGSLQNVRVDRAESQTRRDPAIGDADILHDVTLTLSNFGDDAVVIEVVDMWPPQAVDFVFSDEPQRDAGNLLRWEVTVPAGETIKIQYTFSTPY